MKKIHLLFLVILLTSFSCARDRSYIKDTTPPVSKTVMLGKKPETAVPDSYMVNGERFYPLPDSVGFVENGKASWYGKKFHGHHTANGEIYDMHKKTAAHKILPFGTYVKVSNLSNNRHTIVRINDRGPFVKGRIIDLSYEAAKEIGLIGPGVAIVKVTALGREVGEAMSEEGPKPLVELKDLQAGEFTVQVGSFMEKDNALRLAGRLKVIFDYVEISTYSDENKKVFFRLHVSRSESLDKAAVFEKRLEDMGFTDAFIVRI